ncbi:MAG: NAD(P)-dependent oxidoreductase [Bacteroidales bacterium]|nr:NAD(P)-dependent oxidoreductase [Bacteroidales bacterium]MDT8430051.1 NAD(P)-dependent oxidoreductase [Bacteroidales bacterium]
MTKVLIATEKPFSKQAVAEVSQVFKEAGFELDILEKYTSKDELIAAMPGVHGMIVRSDIVDSDIINAAPSLKIVVRAGAGYDNVDLAAATEKGVTVMNTPGQNSNAVAELVFGMLIYLNRNGFNGTAGAELRGKKIGIHAYGYVGRIVALIAKGMGMKVFAYDPFVDRVVIENDGVTCLQTIEELYSICQYISLHIPANQETRGSVNEALLSLMPEGATLVNTARKEVIDEAGLLKVMAEREDFRYLSDIAPDCREEIEGKYAGRYFFTPKKMGAQTAEANLNAGVAAAKQIVAFIENGENTFKVN